MSADSSPVINGECYIKIELSISEDVKKFLRELYGQNKTVPELPTVLEPTSTTRPDSWSISIPNDQSFQVY